VQVQLRIVAYKTNTRGKHTQEELQREHKCAMICKYTTEQIHLQISRQTKLNGTLIHVEMLWKPCYTWLRQIHRTQMQMEMLYE
jgi:hypothetical protein